MKYHAVFVLRWSVNCDAPQVKFILLELPAVIASVAELFIVGVFTLLNDTVAKEVILSMDIGYTSKHLDKLNASELKFLIPHIQSKIKDINRSRRRTKSKRKTEKEKLIKYY
jgi:hypothetical protein